jgi:hypothetical protein
LQAIANLLLPNGIGHASSSSKEIEVPADGCGLSAAEGVVVELVLIVIELVAKAVVGILEVNAG